MAPYNLSAPEQRLISAVAQGRMCDFAAGEPIQSDEMRDWGEDRTIRADLISELLTTGGDAQSGPPLVELRGAVIVGDMGRFGATDVRLSARSCRFDGDATFEGTTFGTDSSFAGSHFNGKAAFARNIFRAEMSFSGCTFRQFATFEGADFQGRARFDESNFLSSAKFDGTTFALTSSFERAYFRRGIFRSVNFTGYANFETATFEKSAIFSHAVFLKGGRFHLATFGGGSIFVDVTFHRKADFRGSIFVQDASFREATFMSAAKFDGATFVKNAVFNEATFSGTAAFNNSLANNWLFNHCAFESAQVGPFTGSRISLRHATFSARPQVILYTQEVDATYLRASEGIHIIIHCGRTGAAPTSGGVDFSDTEFMRPSIIEGDRSKPEVPLRRSTEDGNWPESFRREIVRTSARAASHRLFEDLDRSLSEMGEELWLRSLERSTLGDVTLSDLDLSECRFFGAHGLDKMRIGPRCLFDTTPGAWRTRLPMRAVARRRVIFEEVEWRRAVRVTADGSCDSTPLAPADIAGLYRDLRKALEDGKNEPAAADFYYGEMEMRRLSQNSSNGPTDASTPPSRVEHLLLSAYWILSGYGLRAWRALAALVVLIATATVLFSWAGLASREAPQRAALVDPTTGIIRYAGKRYSTVDMWTGFEFSLRESIALLQARSLPLYTSPAGTAVSIMLRLAGPILLALAVLAVRARTKR